MSQIEQFPTRIYLLRHGKSGWAEPGQHDFDRTLDQQGYAEAEIIAGKAADRNYRPDIILSSTAMRCRQTAEAIRRAIDEDMEPVFVDELYNGALTTYMAILTAQNNSRSVMLVGHNPTIEQVLAELAGPDQAAKVADGGFPTAGLAVIDRTGSADNGPNGWTMTDFLAP